MENYSETRLRQLLFLLNHYFGDTYSLYEFFGHYDLMIRVWANPNRQVIEELCKKLIEHVLSGDKSDLWVMPCDDVVYLGAEEKLNPTIDVTQAKIHLNQAKAMESDAANRGKGHESESAKWLRTNRVFVRKKIDVLQRGRVKCFCLATPRKTGSQDEMARLFALIQSTITRSQSEPSKLGVSLYKRAYLPMSSELNTERASTYDTLHRAA